MSSADQASRVTSVSIGADIVLAQALAASLAEEGIEAELVLSSDPYVGLEHTSPHRLMIRESDVAIARPIIAAHLQDSLIEEPSSPPRRRGATDFVAGVLLVVFAGGPLIGLVMVIREILAKL